MLAIFGGAGQETRLNKIRVLWQDVDTELRKQQEVVVVCYVY